MNVRYKIFTDCSSVAAAEKVVERCFTRAGLEIAELNVEPYHKGGHVAHVLDVFPDQAWPELVLGVLASAQKIARGWCLHGDLLVEIDAWSNKAAGAGITAIHVQAFRSEADSV